MNIFKKIIYSIFSGGILSVMVSNLIIIENIYRFMNNKKKINNLSNLDKIHYRTSLILIFIFISGVNRISLFFICFLRIRNNRNNRNNLFWPLKMLIFLFLILNVYQKFDIHKVDNIFDFFINIFSIFVIVGNIAFIFICFPSTRESIMNFNFRERFNYINIGEFLFPKPHNVEEDFNEGIPDEDLSLVPEFKVNDIKNYKSLDEFDIDKCVICFEIIKKNDLISKLPYCNHIFHKICFRNWLKIKD